MKYSKYIVNLFIHFLFASSLFAQIEELKYNEVKLTDLDEKYQEKFAPYMDSSFMKNPYTFLSLGYKQVYNGNDQIGNYFMTFALNHYTEKNTDLYHMLSVQNTKNGNYFLATNYLDSAVRYSKETYGYYGWVMLYYFRDYKRALNYLTIYDALTPNFSDFPVGENINMLKGLCFLMQKDNENAILEFSKYMQETTNTIGEKWIDVSTFYYAGIAMSNSGNDKAAINYFNLAIKYNPHFLEAFYEKGKCFNRLGKKKKGLKNLQMAQQLFVQGYQKTDVYVEIFYPVYLQDIEKELVNY